MMLTTKIHNQLMFIEKMDKYNKLFVDLCENYRVEDAVFGLMHNNQIIELKKGYFIAKKEFDNIRECIEMCMNNINSQVIRIIENKFILGDYYSSLSECPYDNKILDIEFYEEIER